MDANTQALKFYQTVGQKLRQVRALLQRPLTLTEKILYTHCDTLPQTPYQRGGHYIALRPDRVAMQDATAQMAVLQFISSRVPQTQIPTTIHCDHLIRAEVGALADLTKARSEGSEVYAFLESAAKKYGMGFWPPGSGIIHQVVLENYAFPGGLLIGTDSHTPNAGGLGMLAIGVGGADAVDVMTGMPWETKFPKILGVKLTGKLSGWTAPKDVILKVAGILTVKGGTGYVLEYFGPGADSISCTGKGTICNMGAEIGATTSVFPFDTSMVRYLQATNRQQIAHECLELEELLTPDQEVMQDPETYYDRVIEIDLDRLEPYVNGPYSPDRAWKISELKAAVKNHGYPDAISVALIGSCTNSSYEDLYRVSYLAKASVSLGLKAQCPLTITPGSEQIRKTIVRDGILEPLEAIGGTVFANACGPCIGQWKRFDVSYGEKNSILTSYNRNFAGRNDANPGTHSFVASPEIVIAMSLAGSMSFNPLEDPLRTHEGKEVFLQPPERLELPPLGFEDGTEAFIPPSVDSSVCVQIDPQSERLALLEPFTPRTPQEFQGVRILAKVEGKCTTDHISPAGPWLKYRGHLDKISDNMLIGATNAFRQEVGKGLNLIDGNIDSFSKNARMYKAHHIPWVIVADENYGEGSSREHAAMEPRYLGCLAVLVKSFARIHESNLMKQGIIPCTFMQPQDYEIFKESDILTFIDLEAIAPQKPLTIQIEHQDGSQETIEVRHSLHAQQIDWFFAGSALNAYAKKL